MLLQARQGSARGFAHWGKQAAAKLRASTQFGVDLLPAFSEGEDEGCAVTSAATEMYHDPEMPQGKFKVVVRIATGEEWNSIKEVLVDGLQDRLDSELLDKKELCSFARAVFPADIPPEQVEYDTPECEQFCRLLLL